MAVPLSSIKLILKSSKLFSELVLNQKQTCSLLFIWSVPLKLTFTHDNFPFVYSQLFIVFRLIIPSMLHIFPFNTAIFASFSAVQVINVYSVLFVTDDGNEMLIRVSL